MRYTAWGAVRYENSTTPTDYTYTGQFSYSADFGLMFYNARWYDAALGRFAQADSVIPGAGDSQAWDRYAYANNNPLYYTDPSGHFVEDFNESVNCKPYKSCLEINPFTRDPSKLRGNEYRDWLVEAINWQIWTDGDPLITEALQQELKPFALQDVGFGEQVIGNILDPDLLYASIAVLFGFRGPEYSPDRGGGFFGKIHVHHMLPRQFKEKFRQAGLNIEDFTVDLSSDFHYDIHGRGGGEKWTNSWNQQWKRFFEQSPNPTQTQILRQLEQMKQEFGIP